MKRWILAGLSILLIGCASQQSAPVQLVIIPPSTTEPFALPMDTSTTTEVPVVVATSTTEPFRDGAVIKKLVAAAEAVRAAELTPTDHDCESWKPLLISTA